jgi:4-hydroxy-3-polyprenylbenzoate decarboxylase
MHSRIALGMGVDPQIHYDDLTEVIVDRKMGPIMAIEVDTGPSQEVVVEGRGVNLLEFPIPRIHDKDGGRYLTSHVVMTRDAETGWTNWGVYRLMVQDRNHLIMGTVPRLIRPRDVEVMAQKYAAKKEPLPFAIAIGVAPSLLYTAAAMRPPMVDESSFAGGFMLDPIPMLKAHLSDIMVPADAEIILEGHIHPGDMADEGPFGWVSYYTPRVRNFVFRVELISHRKNPIIPFVVDGVGPSDTVTIFSVFHSQELLETARLFGLPLRYITLPVEAKLCLGVGALTSQFVPGLPFKVANHMFAYSPFVRKAIVVDADIDPENIDMVTLDMVVKTDPERDVHVQDGKPLGLTENHDWDTGMSSTMFWDATYRIHRDPLTIPRRVEFETCPPLEVQKRVLRRWNEELKIKPEAWTYRKE